jgi:hypothetical protein
MRLNLRIRPVPHSKHTVPVIKASQLMLYREIIAVCSRIHTKHINTMCRQNVELCVKPGGTYSNHWALAASPSILLSNSSVAVFILQWPHVTKSSSAVSGQVTCDVTHTASLASPLLPRLASCGKNQRSSVLSMTNISQWPSTKHTVNKRAQHKPACFDRVSAQWNKIALLGVFIMIVVLYSHYC